MAASDLEPVSVEVVSAGFLNTPNYRPIWVMEVDKRSLDSRRFNRCWAFRLPGDC